MKGRLSGSLTVEVVLLFPVIFLLFVAMLQCGLHFTYRIWGKSLCDQGVLLYQQSVGRGKDPQQAVEEVQKYLEEKMEKAGLREVSITVTERNMYLYRKITVEARAEYSFVYKATIVNTGAGEYRRQRMIRDTIEVIAEAIKRIPGFSQKINQYKEKIGEWIDFIE